MYLDETTLGPARVPFHGHLRLARVPWWYNHGKVGEFGLSLDDQLLGAVLKQSGVGTAEDFATLIALVHRFEVIDKAYAEESDRKNSTSTKNPPFSDDDAKQHIIETADRLQACFGAGGTEVMGPDELALNLDHRYPEMQDALGKWKHKSSETKAVQSVATPERLGWLQEAILQLE